MVEGPVRFVHELLLPVRFRYWQVLDGGNSTLAVLFGVTFTTHLLQLFCYLTRQSQ